jgi:hypothetical protein
VVSLTPGRAQDHQGKLPVSYRDDPGWITVAVTLTPAALR